MSNGKASPQVPPLTLVTLGSAFGLRNVSPFCLKSEMLLTSLGLAFETRVEPDPRKAPKGKLPFLLAGDKTIADSELITEFLNEITQGRVYAGLSDRDRAVGVALSRLVEDHLYWLFVASRWLDDEWFPNVVTGFFHIAPRPIRPLVARAARRQVRQTLYLQGLGRHTAAEQRGFLERDLEALENVVPDDAFLFAEAPCIYDFTVAGMMAGIYDNRPATWATEVATRYRRLRDYTERVQEAVGVFARK
ncbi:MAG: glutathione S-transferase family protein [Candidatus Dadabacteria bacterium]|nr:MAG: glutathione S-transferase family protein [Candidatus Dadabacteria bacterium]